MDPYRTHLLDQLQTELREDLDQQHVDVLDPYVRQVLRAVVGFLGVPRVLGDPHLVAQGVLDRTAALTLLYVESTR